jgi:hypothetical protein
MKWQQNGENFIKSISFSPSTIRMIALGRMRWAYQVSRIEGREICTDFWYER